MSNIYGKIAENRIRESIQKGELENLPGEGEKLEIEHMLFIPEDQRVAFKILKNSGMVPHEMEIKKEIESLQEAIKNCSEQPEKEELEKELNEKKTFYDILMEKSKSKMH